jgi:hypothetical protein
LDLERNWLASADAFRLDLLSAFRLNERWRGSPFKPAVRLELGNFREVFWLMPSRLKRFHHSGQTHFITFCCYRRRTLFLSDASNRRPQSGQIIC